MSESLYVISWAVFLVVALSLDAFAAGIAYGSDQIHVSWQAAIVISLAGSLFLAFSLGIGRLIHAGVPADTAKYIGIMCLFMLGIWKLMDYQIKKYINKHQKLRKDIHFSISKLGFLITIYGNPAAADQDESRSLSVKEALFVSAAMSLDSLVAGIGASAWEIPIIAICMFSFLVGAVSVISGYRLGYRLAMRRTKDLSWLSGMILISMALFKLR